MGIPKRRIEKRLQSYQREEIIKKQINDIMNHPDYKKMTEEIRKEATLYALVKFSYFTLEFMEMQHKYGKKRLTRYLDFLKSRLIDMIKDDTYFYDANSYYKERHGIDVMKLFGLMYVDEE